MTVKDLSKYDNTKGILLSQKSNEAIKLIKTKLRKTAQTIAYAGMIRTASRFTSGHSAGVDSDS